jgi:hypothetical protein
LEFVSDQLAMFSDQLAMFSDQRSVAAATKVGRCISAWFKDKDFGEIACKWMGSGSDCKENGCEKSFEARGRQADLGTLVRGKS